MIMTSLLEKHLNLSDVLHVFHLVHEQVLFLVQDFPPGSILFSPILPRFENYFSHKAQEMFNYKRETKNVIQTY